ncbi:MAG: tetrahydrodipicolinate N-succinyltransferase N-terminal domain-containing protein, partial [Campylobacteraceae bacterium]|nr:tetrahydrodipicolinate N-succinyltransferase N-terminal domain-containing protein [Campylobacteraceae bacterium]
MKPIESEKKFKEYVANIKNLEGYREPIGFGIARVDRGQLHNEKILQATFPVLNWKENYNAAAAFIGALNESEVEVDFSGSEFVCDVKKKFVKNALSIFDIYLKEAFGDNHRNVQVIKTLHRIAQEEGLENNFRIVFLFEDAQCKSIESVYLKLYALSTGKAPLRSLNLNGIFGLLENVAWCVNIPIELDWLKANEIELK